MLVVAGIGSRRTSAGGLDKIAKIATFIARRGGCVRSGHASGADIAFEKGAGDRCIAYLPFKDFGGPLFTNNYVVFSELADSDVGSRALQSVGMFHPKGMFIKGKTKFLMARNYLQIYGLKNRAVDAVVCWAPIDEDFKERGGTGQACRIARHANIPIYNLYYMRYDFIMSRLEELSSSCD